MAIYPRLSEKIFSERNYLRCREDWVAHAVELERTVDALEERIERMREPCPNHPAVMCAPDEGCAVCANST